MKNLVRIALMAMAIGSVGTIGVFNSPIVEKVYAQGGSSVTNFALSEGSATVTINVIGTNPLNKTKEISIKVKLEMPLSKENVDVDGNREENYYKNGEILGTFQHDDSENVSTYDQTLFENSLPVIVRDGVKTIKVSLDGVEMDCPVPDQMETLETTNLEGAINDHEAQYLAATSAGIILKEGTDTEYREKVQEGQELINKAKAGSSDVNQNQIDKKREEINLAFNKIEAAPFNREPLEKLVAEAETLIDKNGKENKRYEREGYEAFYRAYMTGKELSETPDLTKIVAPMEGEPLKTHKDFTDAEGDLKAKMSALKEEQFKEVNKDELKKEVTKAQGLAPSEGKTYTKDSYKALNSAIDKANLVVGDVYATEDKVKEALTILTKARSELKEEDLNKENAYNMSIRYRHQLENGPSDKIDEYFTKEDKQTPVENIIENVIPGQIVKIYLDDTKLIPKFIGYKPTTFFYALDDTSKGLVKLRKDESGREYIIFKAEKNANLDVKYEKAEEGKNNTEIGTMDEDVKGDVSIHSRADNDKNKSVDNDSTLASLQINNQVSQNTLTSNESMDSKDDNKKIDSISVDNVNSIEKPNTQDKDIQMNSGETNEHKANSLDVQDKKTSNSKEEKVQMVNRNANLSSNNAQNRIQAPKTNDSIPIVLYLGLGIASILAMGFALKNK